MSYLHPRAQESRTLFAGKNYQTAWDTLQSAIESEPSHPELLLEKAWQLCFRQQEDEAHRIWLDIRDQIDATQLEQLLGQYWFNRRAMAEKLGVADEQGKAYWDAFQESSSWRPDAATIKLSVVMIAKNEASHLDSCLSSVQGKADEIVLVDTGSSDATIAIAESYGAVVGQFSWCDDFSKARNASLELASGDWALWLDCDEVVDANAWNGIYEALTRRHFGGFFVRIVNFTDEDENSTYTHAPIRLFQLRDEVRFEGRIHEQISQDLDKLNLHSAHLSGATIWHYGYKPAEMRSKNKVQRTIDLLQRQIEESPNDAFHWFNLANTYAVVNDHAKTVEAARKCIQLMTGGNAYGTVVFHTLAASLNASNLPDEALKACYEAKAKGFYSILTQFGIAHSLYGMKRYDEALEAIDLCMEMEWPEDMTGDRGIVTHKSHVLKAQILTAMARAPKAIELLKFALSVDPNFGLANYAMGVALEQVGRLADAASAFEKGAMDPNYAQQCLTCGALSWVKLGEPQQAIAWLEQAWAIQPGNQDFWKQWADIVDSSGTSDQKLTCYGVFASVFVPDPDVWTNWGRALHESGQSDLAISKLEEALTMPNAKVNVSLNLADVLYANQDFLRAAELLQGALSREPDLPEAWFVLGNCFAQLGVFSGAKTAYEQALRIDPNHQKAHHNLGMVTGQVA